MVETEATKEQSAMVKCFPVTKSFPSKNTSKNPKASSKGPLCSSKISSWPENSTGYYIKKKTVQHNINTF